MVRCSALRRSGLLCVALIGILPVWVASCEDAARQDCVRLRQLLDDVSNGMSAWRCTTVDFDFATDVSRGNDEESCGAWVQDVCVGPFPPAGKFACGPRDCAVGMVCSESLNCERRLSYSCKGADETCTEQDCACVHAICGSTAHGSCLTGVEEAPWVHCGEYLTCGS